jgi:hypothetical protein
MRREDDGRRPHRSGGAIQRRMTWLDRETEYAGEVVSSVWGLATRAAIEEAMFIGQVGMIVGDNPYLAAEMQEILDDTKVLVRQARLNHLLRVTS